MVHLTRKLTIVLLTSALGVFAATLWFGLRYRHAQPGSSLSGVCEEWKKAELATHNLGWNLTYGPILRRDGLCPGDQFCEIVARKPQPPVGEKIAEWQDDPIISSMLIELPGGHAGMAATWAIRTRDHAYLWAFNRSQPDSANKQTIPSSDYDRAFEEMACWRQDEPPNRRFGERGYIGFLSLYKEGRSRQMLLTHNDLFEGGTDPDEGKPGRFFKALEPLRSYW